MSNFEKSVKLFERAEKVIPGGSNKFVRKNIESPTFIDRAEGSHFWDPDGNEFIDYGTFGAVILGHNHPKVTKAVIEQIKKGPINFNLNHELDIELAEKMIKDIPCAEMVHVINTGTEATAAALRIARAYTEKPKVVKFAGHYHGWLEWTIFSLFGGSLPIRPITCGLTKNSIADTIVLPWQDLEAVEKLLSRQRNEIAMVITEPYQFNGTCIVPEKGYLEGLRKITEENDVLLCFDEVISGFRVALGGVQEIEGVIPDIATYGKAIANGYPIAAIAGKREVMEVATNWNRRAFIKGTYHSNPISTVAALTTITELEDKACWRHLEKIGGNIMKGMRDAIEDADIEAIVQGVPSCFCIIFTNQEKIMRTEAVIDRSIAPAQQYPHNMRSAVFSKKLINRGINARAGGRWHLFVAHNEEDAMKSIEAVTAGISEAKKIQ